jgi:hypothetical protein
VERQRLLHKGRDMDNAANLSTYSTGSEMVLFLVVKFPSPSTWQSTSVAPDGSAPCVVLRGKTPNQSTWRQSITAFQH